MSVRIGTAKMECTAGYLRVNIMYRTVESANNKEAQTLSPIVKLPAWQALHLHVCRLTTERHPQRDVQIRRLQMQVQGSVSWMFSAQLAWSHCG